jgi:hypothetical protein
VTTREQIAIFLYLMILGCVITAFDPPNQKGYMRYHNYGYVPSGEPEVRYGLRGSVEG